MQKTTFLQMRQSWLRCIIVANAILLISYFSCVLTLDQRSQFTGLIAVTFVGALLLLLISLLFTFPKNKKLLLWGWVVFILGFVLGALTPAT